MFQNLKTSGTFHITDLAFCLVANNTCTCSIIMRLLIHHGEYKTFVVPCHCYGMFKFFSQAFQSGGGGGGGIVYSILSAFSKHLVTLKFDTSVICFLLSGETIFFLKFKAVSNTLSRFVDFFWIQGRAMNSKRGTSLVRDWCLKK